MRHLAVLSIALASCVSIIDLDSVEPPHEFVDAQSLKAVGVHVDCGKDKDSFRGSGVIVDRHHIMTAWHIIEACPTGDITAALPDGSVIEATAWAALVGADLLILETDTDLGMGAQPIADIDEGDITCMSAVYPERVMRCGHAILVHKGTAMFNVWHSVTTLSGNSGAGVYDEFGSLVGIVTHDFKLHGKHQGGVFTTIFGKGL